MMKFPTTSSWHVDAVAGAVHPITVIPAQEARDVWIKVERGQVREVTFMELLGDEARRGESFHESKPLTMDRVFRALWPS
jgi:hypothetical protein